MSDLLAPTSPCAGKRPTSQGSDDLLPRQAEAGVRALLDGSARYQHKQALIEAVVCLAEQAPEGGDLNALALAAHNYRVWQAQQRMEGRSA